MQKSWAIGLAAAILVSGCAEMTHLTRKRALEGNDVLLIDAKQRAIHAGEVDGKTMICAEPSPDALSALAAQSATNLSTPKGLSAAQAFSIAEAAGSIGLRTQSIQLMRDHMYRVCELYQSGQVSPTQAMLLHRRFQSNMVSILAIEQLTGAMRAPAIVLSGSAASGDAEAVTRLTNAIDAQQAKIASASKAVSDQEEIVTSKQQAQAAAQAAFDSDPSEERRASLDKAIKDREEAERQLSQYSDARQTAEEGLRGLRQSLTLAQASGSAATSGVIEQFTHSAKSIPEVAKAVQAIVTETFAQSNEKDLCMVLLSDRTLAVKEPNPNSMLKKCIASAEEELKLLLAR